MRPALFAILFLSACSPCLAQPDPVAAGQVLARVRANVAALNASIPSFSCDEEIDSQRLGKGQVKEEMKLDSDFRMVRESSKSSSKSGLTETRTHKTVDGKPVKNQKDRPPISFYGGYLNMLDVLNLDQCMDYTLATPPAKAPTGTILLLATRKQAPGETCASTRRSDLHFLVDPTSYQVLHLDSITQDAVLGGLLPHLPFIPIPSNSNTMTIAVDYASFDLGGQSFYLPSRIVNDLIDKKKPLSLHYVADYTACQRYTATARIVSVQTPE